MGAVILLVREKKEGECRVACTLGELVAVDMASRMKWPFWSKRVSTGGWGVGKERVVVVVVVCCVK
jgi:hypothetical protein